MSNAKTNKKVDYAGYQLSVKTVNKIKEALVYWDRRDLSAWMFAGLAYDIVGEYEEGATQALAKKMGVSSPSTPEGYAKAWELKLDLHIINHKAPLPGLFISHYITVGKSYIAGKITIEDADLLLREAAKWGKPVDWLRSKLSGKMGDDSWRNSQLKMIDMIKTHTINAPYTGVNEEKASLASWVGRVFVRVLEWSLDDSEISVPRVIVDIVKSELTNVLQTFDMDETETETDH